VNGYQMKHCESLWKSSTWLIFRSCSIIKHLWLDNY